MLLEFHDNILEISRNLDRMKLKKKIFIEIFHDNICESSGDIIEICYEYLSRRNLYVAFEDKDHFKSTLHGLLKTFKQYWKKANYCLPKFNKSRSEWLDQDVDFVFHKQSTKKKKTSRRGRKEVPFHLKSLRGQQSAIFRICSAGKHNTELLLKAGLRSSRLQKNKELSNALKSFIEFGFKLPNNRPTRMSPNEGLALLIDADLSQKQFQIIRNRTLKCGADVIPPYKSVREQKQQCIPVGLEVSATKAHVSLQNMVNHTSQRIVMLKEEKIDSIMSTTEHLNLKLIIKWGFDGSSGQSRYNQQIDNATFSDANLFAVTLTPLILETNDSMTIWKNQCTSSVRFCRPIILEFVKESKELNVQTKLDVEKEIEDLEATLIFLPNGKTISVTYEFHLSMVDGKVVAHVTNTKSFQSCTCCGATPSQMNQLDNFSNGKFAPNPSSLNYGISPLHCWIRFFDLILHIAYRMSIKKWQMRTEHDKNALKFRKLEIQEDFIKNFNLRVDMPAAGGSGNSNTGNVARKAFSNPQLLSQTTGVDVNLIQRLFFILIAISCDQLLDVEKFRMFCYDTAKLYIMLYDWFPMPASLHRVLIHGADIAACSTIPLGLLSEEAAESRNKLYKSDRLNHSRKTSREHSIYDMMSRSLVSSDPVLSEFDIERRMRSLKKKDLPHQVQELLRADNDQENRNDVSRNGISDEELDLELFQTLNEFVIESDFESI